MNTQILFYILSGILGVVIGFGLTRFFIFRNNIGVLREDRSDPDEAPYLFLELKQEGLVKIQKQRYVVLKVLRENYIPRE